MAEKTAIQLTKEKRNKKKPKQKFGGETIKRKGKEVNLREWVQSNAEGTNLYETLETTGAIRIQQKTDISEIAQIFQGQDKRTIMEHIEKVKSEWKTLDKSIRKEFDNDVNKFIENGQKWVGAKIKEMENITKNKKTETQTKEGENK